MRFCHNFWLGDPIDLKPTRLNCILQDLFRHASLYHIWSAQIRAPDTIIGIFRLDYLIIAVISLNCLSLGAALWLNNKIKDYVELFKATKKLPCCIPTIPVLHRSALYSLIKSDGDDDFEMLEDIMIFENISDALKRQNSACFTALHVVSDRSDWRKVFFARNCVCKKRKTRQQGSKMERGWYIVQTPHYRQSAQLCPSLRSGHGLPKVRQKARMRRTRYSRRYTASLKSLTSRCFSFLPKDQTERWFFVGPIGYRPIPGIFFSFSFFFSFSSDR